MSAIHRAHRRGRIDVTDEIYKARLYRRGGELQVRLSGPHADLRKNMCLGNGTCWGTQAARLVQLRDDYNRDLAAELEQYR